MKKQIYNSVFLTAFFAFLLISCEKTKDQKDANFKENQTSLENLNGILNFESAESFFATLASINSMNKPEREKWESSMGFVSQQTLYERFLSELDKVRTEAELNNILNQNKDIVTVSSDSEIKPTLEYGQFPSIVNRQGYFSINGILHKVTQEYTYIAKNQEIKDIDKVLIEDGNISDKIVVINNISNVITKNCGNHLEGQVTEGNRRAKIYMDAFKVVSYNGYSYFYQDYVQWSIKGFKKVLGAWYSYNTIYTYRNVSFSVMTMFDFYGKGTNSGPATYAIQYGSYPGPEESPYEDWVYSWTVAVGHVFSSPTELTLTPPYFTQVAGQGRSRGTTGYATISCGY